jgi:hypothetical protein
VFAHTVELKLNGLADVLFDPLDGSTSGNSAPQGQGRTQKKLQPYFSMATAHFTVCPARPVFYRSRSAPTKVRTPSGRHGAGHAEKKHANQENDAPDIIRHRQWNWGN